MKRTLSPLKALLLCPLFMLACADANEVEHEEVSSTAQALNGTKLQIMSVAVNQFTGWSAWHQQKEPAGWSGWGGSTAVPNTALFGVEGSMWGQDTHWIQYGQTLYHNMRLPSNGNWANPNPNGWQKIPGASDNSSAAYQDVGMAEVSNSSGGTDLHICSSIRITAPGPFAASLVWQAGTANGWLGRQAIQKASGFGFVTAVDCSGIGNVLHLVFQQSSAASNAGTYHMTLSGGNWSTPTPLSNGVTTPIKLATASFDGLLHVMMVGANAALYHRLRWSDGSFSPWNLFPSQDITRWADVSMAEVGGKLRVVAIAENGNPFESENIATAPGFSSLTGVNNTNVGNATNVSIAAAAGL